ncbi:DUF2934 domain-containing protein [Methylobacterium sp. C25]|uniref:DUF2934 domain-containing protein n=1 Tax=Methylobacterium sp. C25 TaxID=2721622 RepID=UPI002277DE97|nr:DUF2934 domain-containing protein [Methylobacterium sp. C25]MCE4226738.1 DUF2934 domain-containing protein [Methylobacterium sp. C25]
MTRAKDNGVAIGGGEGRIPAERIRQRAYELWERNHCPPGLEMRFWLLAEQQLRAEVTPEPAEGEVA